MKMLIEMKNAANREDENPYLHVDVHEMEHEGAALDVDADLE